MAVFINGKMIALIKDLKGFFFLWSLSLKKPPPRQPSIKMQILFFQALLMDKLICMIKKHTWNKIHKI